MPKTPEQPSSKRPSALSERKSKAIDIEFTDVPRLNTQMENALEEAKKRKNGGEVVPPEPAISSEAAKLEAEEQKQIDEAIARMRGEGGVAPDLSSEPNIQPKSTGATSAVESPALNATAEKEAPVPSALKEIFGDVVPRKAVQMYEKLKSPKKQESYLAHLRTEKEKEDKKNLAKEEKSKRSEKTPAKPKQSASVPEKSFDPHSVRDTDVDITEPPASTQEDMDALAGESAKREIIGKSEVEQERSRLRGLVSKLMEKTKGAARDVKESIGKLSAKEQLAGRSKELDARFNELGGEWAKRIGESYNKMPLKWKIATGVALTIGLGITLPVSTVGTMAFGGAMAVQRAAGMFGMFVNLEKHLQGTQSGQGRFANAEWYKKLMTGSPEKEKNVAALMAMVWTFGLGAGMAQVAREISETEFARWTGEWLKGHWPSGATGASSPAVSPEQSPSGAEMGTAQPPESMPIPAEPVEAMAAPATPEASPLVEEPAAAAAAGEGATAAVPEAVQQMPVVEASPGHGYEYMAKRLWEQLQEKSLDPEKFAEGSDVRRLLDADADSINKVVHDLATEHGFYKPDGASVRIDLGDKLAIGANGNLALNGHETPITTAETPPYEPPRTVSFTPEGQLPNAESEMAAAQTPTEAGAPTLRAEVPPLEPPYPMVDVPSGKVLSGEEIPLPPNVPEAPAGSTPAVPEEETAVRMVTNGHGLAIPLTEPHIYSGGTGETFVYGGTMEQRMSAMADYLRQHPSDTVIGTDESGKYRVAWGLVEGKIVPGEPLRTGGFLGLFSSLAQPPGPEDLTRMA